MNKTAKCFKKKHTTIGMVKCYDCKVIKGGLVNYIIYFTIENTCREENELECAPNSEKTFWKETYDLPVNMEYHPISH